MNDEILNIKINITYTFITILLIIILITCIASIYIAWFIYKVYSAPRGIVFIGNIEIRDLEQQIKEVALIKTYLAIGTKTKIQTEHISHYAVLLCAENYNIICSPEGKCVKLIRLEPPENKYERIYINESLKTLDGDYYTVTKTFQFKQPVTIIDFINHMTKHITQKDFAFFKNNCQNAVIETLMYYKPTIDLSSEIEQGGWRLFRRGIYELLFDLTKN